MEDEKNDHSEKENILILLGDYVAVRNFSNTDAGKLFHTICRYALGENIGDLEDKIQVAFSFFKVRLDENRKNWEKTRIERKKAGRLGGLAKKANATFAKQKKQTIANVAVNVNDNVNDNVNVNDIKKKASPSDAVITILEDLNKRTKSKKGFSPLAQCNQNLIKARMSEGFTVENFISVNEKKVKQWLHDPEMSKYLRPATLYGNKFDGYLNEVVCDLPATNSNYLNKNKFQSADERRIENNKKIFEESLVEVKNERNRQEEEGGDSGFFSQLHGELPESHN
jgi:uncharacterized phage protein (TIGR02220 family)